jgi:TIR domain/TPR repeat/Tetratricopeptide repeat
MSLVQTEKLLLFFSYARQDRGLRDKLEEHLSNLKYRGLITTWHIREIGAGEDWQQQVDIHLESAHIILLLISSSFMASQYCYSMEMTRAMERHQQGKARVIPILLRPVLFTGAPFAMLKMLPTNGKPVVSWRNRDSAFVDIALGIERVVREEATKSTVFGQPSQPPGQVAPGWGGQLGQPQQPAWPVIDQAPPYQQYQQSPPSPGYLPRRRRSVASLGLALVSLLVLSIAFAGAFFVLRSPGSSPVPTFPGVLAIALALLGILIAILLIILWRRIIQARRRVKVIEEAEQQQQEEARGRKHEEAYYEQALQAYDRSPYLDPLARRGKGNALAALGRHDEALQSLYLSAILDPRSATYARMGDVYLALRRYSDAVTAYERAIALDPQLAPAYASLGDALEELGRTQDAEQAREQAKQLEAL